MATFSQILLTLRLKGEVQFQEIMSSVLYRADMCAGHRLKDVEKNRWIDAKGAVDWLSINWQQVWKDDGRLQTLTRMGLP